MNYPLVLSGYLLIGLGFLFIDIMVPDNIWDHLKDEPSIQWMGEKGILLAYIIGVVILWPSIAYEWTKSIVKNSKGG